MDLNQVRSRMDKSIESLKVELGKLRSGRATTAILNTVTVDYYGTKTPLKNMATLSAPEPRLLTVQPWDMSQMGAVEKAILSADLGLQPNNDGKIIRIQIPPLSEERRKELVKVVKRVGEDARVAVRMIRRDVNEALKAENLPEDEFRKQQNTIQKITDDTIQQIDFLLQNKEKGILNV